MILDKDIKQQLAQYLELMEGTVLIKVSADSDDISNTMVSLVDELVSMSPKIKAEKSKLLRTPSFSINRTDEETGVAFAGIPLGHEFNSLVLALLQVSGRAPKLIRKQLIQLRTLKENTILKLILV